MTLGELADRLGSRWVRNLDQYPLLNRLEHINSGMMLFSETLPGCSLNEHTETIPVVQGTGEYDIPWPIFRIKRVRFTPAGEATSTPLCEKPRWYLLEKFSRSLDDSEVSAPRCYGIWEDQLWVRPHPGQDGNLELDCYQAFEQFSYTDPEPTVEELAQTNAVLDRAWPIILEYASSFSATWLGKDPGISSFHLQMGERMRDRLLIKERHR